jgi:outer membrane lipoprotein carrier protein
MRSLIPAAAALVAFIATAPELTARAQQPAPTGSSVAPPAADVAAAVGKVQAFYDASNTFKSHFQQKFWVKAYNQEKTSEGDVTFAKPGKMNWAYQTPAGNRVVSDGQKVKVYEAANKQMYEQQVSQATSQHAAALSFLTGQGKLSDSFTFELFPGSRLSFTGGYVLVGTPKQPTPSYSKVLFYVDEASSQVRRVLIVDGQGNRNRFDFSGPRINDPVADDSFQFTPPAGTSIIRP